MKLKDMIADLMTNDVAVRKSTWKVNEYIYYDRKARNFMLHLHNDNEEHANGIMLDYLTNEGTDWNYHTPIQVYSKDEVLTLLANGDVRVFYNRNGSYFDIHSNPAEIYRYLSSNERFYGSNPV